MNRAVDKGWVKTRLTARLAPSLSRSRRHRWLFLWLSVGLFALLVLAIGLGLGLYHWALAGTTATKRELVARNDYLRARHDALLVANAQLRQAKQTAQTAVQELRGALESLQAELVQTREELALYRSLVSTSEVALHVARLRLRPLAEPANHYHYRLVIAQFKEAATVTQGAIRLYVNGQRQDEVVRLGLEELGQKADAWRLRVRYLQRLTGTLALPRGVTPVTVEVVIEPAKQRTQPISKTFPWQKVLTEQDQGRS